MMVLHFMTHSFNQGSLCEISGAGVGFYGRRLKSGMTTQAALLEGIYSRSRDFSSQG